MSIINKRFNRRRFIQASSAALIASPFFSSPEIVVKAGANDALRIGVVGCGGRSGVLLKFLSENPNVRVTALCDPDSHRLANAKKNWIDLNAGRAIEDSSIEAIGEELYDLVIETANGKLCRSEEAGYHDIAIFKQGVTL